MPSHKYPKQCYNILKFLDDTGSNCWATKIRALLYKYGFSFIWICQDVGDVNLFIRMFKHRVVNYCTLDWQTAFETSSSYHYNNSKSLLTIENKIEYGYSIKI